MTMASIAQLIIGVVDLAAAFLFMYGLKRMSSPVTAPSGIFVAGIGMLVAVLASFLYVFDVGAAARPHLMTNVGLGVVALIIGGGFAWWGGKKVAMTAMPQMVALYNGMGGGAAGAIRRGGAVRHQGARNNSACRDAARRTDRLDFALGFADRVGQTGGRHQETAARKRAAIFQHSRFAGHARRRWLSRLCRTRSVRSTAADATADLPVLRLRADLRHPDDVTYRRRGYAGGDLDL